MERSYSISCQLQNVLCETFWMLRAQHWSKFIVSCGRSMGLASWASRRCITGADSLQQFDNMCMMRSTMGGHHSLRMTLWSMCVNTLWRIDASQLWNSVVISCSWSSPCAENCHGASVVQKIVWQVGAKGTNTSTQIKVYGVSIDISATERWWWQWVSGPDHHRWWTVSCTHYPGKQAAVTALASQWISLQYEIQADFVSTESDVYSVLESKQQSLRWHHSESTCNMKFKQTLSAQKVMCTKFWNRWSILLINFLTRSKKCTLRVISNSFSHSFS